MKYETFEKMNKLWLQYMTIVLQVRPDETQNGLDLKDPAVQNSLCQRVIKADFSGAYVKVVKSKDGREAEGIVVRETARTLVIITKENDKVITLLKEGTVFQIQLPDNLKSREN